MTGGVVYLKLEEAMGLDEQALQRRLAKGAEVVLRPVDDADQLNLQELLTAYITQLETNEQQEEIETTRRLLRDWRGSFLKVVPKK
jgi:glutamate synthase (NADPH/NADH) large chain